MHGTIDALNIISAYKSYHNFLSKKEKAYDISFTSEESKMLEYLSKIIAPGKRILEVDVLNAICSTDDVFDAILHDIEPNLTQNAIDNITALFDGSFYKNRPALIRDGCIEEHFHQMLANDEFYEAVVELMELGRQNNDLLYSELYEDTNFALNRMYTYDDVCRLMNWAADVNAQNIGGYKYDARTNTFSVFINYVKGEEVIESQRYEDHFESRNSLVALSKSTEDRNSKNMVRVRDHVSNGTDIHLFVRKNKNDEGSKEFYYLGKMDFIGFINDERPVKVRYRLRNEVRADLYDYFNS